MFGGSQLRIKPPSQKQSKPHSTIYSRRSRLITCYTAMNLAEDEGTSRTTGRKSFADVFGGGENISAGYSTEPQAMNARTFRHSSHTPHCHNSFFSEMRDVQGVFEARRKLVGFFSVRLRNMRPSVEKAHSKTSSGHTCGKYRADYPT